MAQTANIFQKMQLSAFKAGVNPRTEESREWFRRKAATMRSVNRSQLMKEEPIKLKNRQIAGQMYMFFLQIDNLFLCLQKRFHY